jgi:CRP/FNR family transcriptional regulator, cyclic AMP receptor protein
MTNPLYNISSKCMFTATDNNVVGRKEGVHMISLTILKNYNLFAGLEKPELQEIAALCARQTFKKDAVIFDPYSVTDDLFLVEGGNEAVRIEVPIPETGKKFIIHTLSKGETFGWASLVPSHSRTALARCLQDVDIIRINGKKLISLLDKNEHLGYLVMKNLSGIISTRLAYTTIMLRREVSKVSTTPVRGT